MRSSQSLDALLHGEPHGTFHDAALLTVYVDYSRARFVAEFDVCIGDPSVRDESIREQRRRGQIVVEGLTLWMLDALDPSAYRRGKGLWLTSEGPLENSPEEFGKGLASALKPQVGWFLYFGDVNAFGYLAGERASFMWL